MMSEIIKFQLKGIKMIRLKGLNKILRIGLLAGALLGIATPLMAKPLLSDEDLFVSLRNFFILINHFAIRIMLKITLFVFKGD